MVLNHTSDKNLIRLSGVTGQPLLIALLIFQLGYNMLIDEPNNPVTDIQIINTNNIGSIINLC
jgi:ABC-type cobalamin/Fe3+-siderophores transport system ATPase subunit